MGWLILIGGSLISATIIFYVFWPSNRTNQKMKYVAIVLSISAFIIPLGIKLYLQPHNPEKTQIASKKNITFPNNSTSIWAGGNSEKLNQPSNPAHTKDMSLSGVTSRLEEKLKNNPDNISGWILLGRSYAAMGENVKAIKIFKDKIKSYPENVDLLIFFGETLTQLNDRIISKEAYDLYAKAAHLSSGNIRAEYNIALYESQKGDHQKAHDRLSRLLNKNNSNEGWSIQIQKQKSILANKLGIGKNTGSLSAEQIENADKLSSSERAAFIKSIVDSLAERLKENPNDLEGWKKIGRSYVVLGDKKNAIFAYKKALKIAPNYEEIKTTIKNLIGQLSL